MTASLCYSPCMQCAGPNCTNEAAHVGLCVAHYAQQRRHPKRPLRPLRSGDPTEQISFRVPSDLRRAVAKAARAEGITETEWWKRAARAALGCS